MSGLQELPESLHKAVVLGVVLYFVLFIYGAATGQAIAIFASNVLFGLVALVVGVFLLKNHQGDRSPMFAAGVALTVGGLAQLAWVVSGNESFNLLATGGVIAGVAFYFYSVRAEK